MLRSMSKQKEEHEILWDSHSWDDFGSTAVTTLAGLETETSTEAGEISTGLEEISLVLLAFEHQDN